MINAIKWFKEHEFTWDDKITIKDVIDLQRDAQNSNKTHADSLSSALRRAVEIIKLHVPDDSLGINSNCGEPVAQTWPIKDEEIFYMEQALGQYHKDKL